MGISENELNLLLFVLLTSGLSIVYSTRVKKALIWWTLQTFAVSILILVQGIYSHELSVIIVGVLLLVGKAGIIPVLLGRVLQESKTEWVGEIYLKRTSSVVVAGALTLLAYEVTKPLMALPQPGFRNGLAVGLALIFYGLLLMMIRKVAIVQVLGILLIDNGIFLAGFFLTQGMPLLVEMGSMFDILVGIVIIVILSKQMLENYDSLNVDHMRSLKG
ncbi:membrane-bound (NiFe)-hydrogenase (Ehf-type, Group 4f), antiporter subunit C [Candidatus Desulfosporosinus infrequens]|uniref:Membrane-bound (NiFe)-hydrogenase (Ehf-type, Group 4f), antiporter subunit C n=1 Tax=Candidatus Desulfosporosinus infrequens TaxID=2043169 RepID=A0A2U3LUK8_9FIRM|nr:membrane-bound (NiFe)-hydrogenase (Ehf-type, Group 4f), antiporter subunit C [Candidatus Desulfosporosinus infrequens]